MRESGFGMIWDHHITGLEGYLKDVDKQAAFFYLRRAVEFCGGRVKDDESVTQPAEINLIERELGGEDGPHIRRVRQLNPLGTFFELSRVRLLMQVEVAKEWFVCVHPNKLGIRECSEWLIRREAVETLSSILGNSNYEFGESGEVLNRPNGLVFCRREEAELLTELIRVNPEALPDGHYELWCMEPLFRISRKIDPREEGMDWALFTNYQIGVRLWPRLVDEDF